MNKMSFNSINVQPLSKAMGAEITGVDLGSDLSDEQFTEIRQALFTYGAIGFRDQELSHEDHYNLARRFGTLEVHPIVEGMKDYPEIIRMFKPAGEAASFGVGWHSDNSFFEKPSLGSIVYAEKVPPVGGDTLFTNQQLAYQALSDGMKKTLNGLQAVHTAKDAYTSPTAAEKYGEDAAIRYRQDPIIDQSVVHPLVIQHPTTGVKALYVNAMFTDRIDGWTREESRPLIDFLCAHATREEFQCRFRWARHSLAMWDNRIVQHAALNDYEDYERILYRITVNGEKLS